MEGAGGRAYYPPLSILNPGVYENLHVLLWKRINNPEKIRSHELQNGNYCIKKKYLQRFHSKLLEIN